MNTRMSLATFFAVLILALCLFGSVRAQESQEALQAFYDSTIFGMRIQANATALVRPTENVTIILSLTSQAESYVKNLNVSIFGFLNGTYSVLMSNMSDNDFWLNRTSPSRCYNWTFPVPEWISGMTYGEVRLANSIELGLVTLHNDGFMCGFYMTNVENVYLGELEHNYSELTQDYQQLNNTFEELTQNYNELNNTFSDLTRKYDQLNNTCVKLQGNLTALQGNTNELASTREVATVLGVTTVVFVVTTMYLILRKPKQYW